MEIVPFLAGMFCGRWARPGWSTVAAAIVFGLLWAGAAGELAQGPAGSALAVAVDSAAVLAGALVVNFVRRQLLLHPKQ